MGFFNSIGNAVGGVVGDVIDFAGDVAKKAAPILGAANPIWGASLQLGSGVIDGLLHKQAVSQQVDDVRKSDRRDRGDGGGRGCGSRPQGCAGGVGGGGSTLEQLAEVLGNLQQDRVKKMIDKGTQLSTASDDELLKLSTQLQTDKLLLDVAMNASKTVIDGIGQNIAKPLQN